MTILGSRLAIPFDVHGIEECRFLGRQIAVCCIANRQPKGWFVALLNSLTAENGSIEAHAKGLLCLSEVGRKRNDVFDWRV